MVIDSFSNLAFYASLNPHFEKVIKFFESNDVASFEAGKYEIDGEDVFVNILERELKKPEDAALEVHDVYVDIQVLFSGDVESYGFKKRAVCTQPRSEMDTDKDVLFYDDKPDTYVSILPGDMIIFFPEDGHAPLVGEGNVKKAIVKIKA